MSAINIYFNNYYACFLICQCWAIFIRKIKVFILCVEEEEGGAAGVDGVPGVPGDPPLRAHLHLQEGTHHL